MATPDELKAQGNAAFSAGKYRDAVALFSRAIELDGSNHVLFSNRSAAQAGLQDYAAALADAEKTVELKPDWAKGYSRLGAALYGLGELDKAVAAYQKGLDLEPGNESLKAGLAEVQGAKSRGDDSSGAAGVGNLFKQPDALAKIATHPKTAAYLQQPDFVSMLTEVQRTPASFSKYMNDPRMMQVLGVLLGVDIRSGHAEGDTRDTAATGPKAPPRAPEPVPEVEMTDAEKEAKAAAVKEKELGNDCYKAKKFDDAIAHYNKAIELDPTDISFLTNRAAVFFEQGKLDECITDCDSAVTKAYEVHADFKMIARALARKGSALQKRGDLEGAITAFSKSLTEHRTAETLKKLNDAERTLKEMRQKEYEDPVKGEEERELGNKLFKEQKYPEAVQHYTEAIKRNPRDHRAYSNRSACYTKLTAWTEGLKDAEKCLELEPSFSKGYSRKGAVLFFMKDYDKALKSYQQGLELDPENEELREGVQRCVSQINRVSRGEVGEDELRERQERAMADPEVQMILTDPIMRQVLNDFQEDPKAAQHHMKNAQIMAKLQKLINAGIVRVN